MPPIASEVCALQDGSTVHVYNGHSVSASSEGNMCFKNSMSSIAVAAALYVAHGIGVQAQDVSKYPDWSGQWKSAVNLLATFGAQWDPSKPSGRGQQAPLTPEYQARFEANLADQAAGGQGDNRYGYCLPVGMPRMMSVVYPMEIIITPKTTYVLTDNSEPRRIFTDGREWPKEIEPSFSGLSIGTWVDADSSGHYATLEVETRGFRGPRTFEGSGIRLHDDDQTVIKERIYLDTSDKNILVDEITTIDHALTRPWIVDKRYSRGSDPHPIWHFNQCSENNPLVRIGNEGYYINAEGLLMPVKKGQRPPDLRYFESVVK